MRSSDRATAGTLKQMPRATGLTMTPDAEVAAAPEAEPRAPRRTSDMLGIAYLATLAIVMTIWVGGLIWAAISVFEWVVS